jgi:hypothetical protein
VAWKAGRIPNTSAANSDVTHVNARTGITSPTSVMRGRTPGSIVRSRFSSTIARSIPAAVPAK